MIRSTLHFDPEATFRRLPRAFNKDILDRVFPDSRLAEAANLLVVPNLDAANITFNMLKAVAG